VLQGHQGSVDTSIRLRIGSFKKLFGPRHRSDHPHELLQVSCLYVCPKFCSSHNVVFLSHAELKYEVVVSNVEDAVWEWRGMLTMKP
jgi:hypothetical protein